MKKIRADKYFIKKNESSQSDKKKRVRKLFVRVFLSCILGLILALISRGYILFPLKIPNQFMEPSYKKGSFVFVLLIYNKGNLKIGDVVVAKNPLNPNSIFLSRIAGKQGDKIQMIDKELIRNKNTINENSKKVQFTDKRAFFPKSFSTRDNTEEIFVKERSFFLLSDNRDESIDSRELGLISEDLIVGKVIY